ncbi:MAG: hypothetical protein ACR2K5_00580 [Pseudolabrys sp.]
MRKVPSIASILGACVSLAALAAMPAAAKELKVISEKTASGFGHNESVVYDSVRNVFYTGDFGGELKPAEKDGKGKINQVSFDGKLVETIFPPAGTTMNKPKGLWIRRDKLFVADIDAVWEIDLKTKEGKKLDLPINYANDVAVIKNVLYISDNRNDAIVRVEPADFMNAKSPPAISFAMKGKGIFPNGIYPGRGKILVMGGFKSKEEPLGLYSMSPGKDPKPLGDKIGMVDGLYYISNGDILATDWVTGSLFQWNKQMGIKKLAGDFKGPADFCVVPTKQGLLVVVPDLVKGELRFVQLGR